MISRSITFLLSIGVLFLLLPLSDGMAFIPEGEDIVKLAVEKIVEPKGLIVEQKRKIFLNRDEESAPIEAEDSMAHPQQDRELNSLDAESIEEGSVEEETDLEETDLIEEETIVDEILPPQDEPAELKTEFAEITEKLWISYPGKFRSESTGASHDMIYVQSNGKFIKIIDEFIESEEKSFLDYYTDIILFREQESLSRRLKALGVDLSMASLKRHNGLIYFVVGRPPVEGQPGSSFWVEKDSHFPGRYTIAKENLFIDIFYKDWKKVSRTWYPMKVSIFLNGVLFSEIEVDKFELEADFKKNLFNISRLKKIYPESGSYKNESGPQSDELDELEKSIEEFKKLYE